MLPITYGELDKNNREMYVVTNIKGICDGYYQQGTP